MTFLRIALFVVFLIAVFFFRQWLPWSTGTVNGPQVVTQETGGRSLVVGNGSAQASAAPANNSVSGLEIDGHPITSVDKIRNFQVVDGKYRGNGYCYRYAQYCRWNRYRWN